MTLVLGVDGCPGGWCGVALHVSGPEVRVANETHYETFEKILASNAAVIAIDIPIGLLDVPGGRLCDREARRLIAPRGSSVFPSPSRAMLIAPQLEPFFSSEAMDRTERRRLYGIACAVNRETTKKKISQQSFSIARKIGEVDRVITPSLQARVREVHPEVCFWALNGQKPLRWKKKSSEGQIERWRLLEPVLPELSAELALPLSLNRRCGLDDYIDALAAALTAARVAEGNADRLPVSPARGERGDLIERCSWHGSDPLCVGTPHDELGLRMEMWYPAP